MPTDHEIVPDPATARGASGAEPTAQAALAPQSPVARDASDGRPPPHATPTASVDAREFTITVPRAQALFDQHNRKVPEARTLQHYCKVGRLDGRKITHLNEEGTTVSEWLIHEPSLLTYICSQPVLKNKPEIGAACGAPATVPAAHAPQPIAVSVASGAGSPRN